MTFDEQLRRAFEALTDRLHEGVRREVQIAVDEALAAKREADATTPAGGADVIRLRDSIQSLGRARTLSETLDTLATAAAREASRVAVLTLAGGRAHGWRFIGFGPFDQAPPVDLRFNDLGVIASASRSNAVVTGSPAPAFAEPGTDIPCVAVPIALAGEVVAVVYADGGRPNDVLPANATGSMRLNADAIEILARYAARGIEAITAFTIVRSLSTPPSASDHGVDDEDVVGARRYARLLVSEIKLYHEDSVAAGRRDRDLGSRLGGEIARARMLYEQRIPAHIRALAPYFDDELVKTLADGDRSLLETA